MMMRRSGASVNSIARRRLMGIVILSMIGFGAIVVKLFYIQILQHDYYQKIADAQQTRTYDYAAERGEIFVHDTTDGAEGLYPLAVNKVYYAVSVDPSRITRPVNTAEALSKVLGVPYDVVLPRVQKTDDTYEPIVSRATEEQVAELKKTGFEGIHYAKDAWRYYPDKSVGSHILGFYSPAEGAKQGTYGIEGYWETTLAGVSAKATVLRDAIGSLLPSARGAELKPQNGADIILTIDRNVQYEICRVLEKGIATYAADTGTVIVMESSTGKILGMCNYPSFDPNEYQKVESVNVFNNGAVFEAYEPGSVFKPIAMAIAVDQKKVSPTTIYEDTGEITISGRPIRNFDKKAHGTKTMTEVLQESLNLGLIFATKGVPNRMYYEYVKKFGFGEKTGIEVSQEVAGSLGKLSTAQDIYKATTSFGQGLTVTPLQMITAINVLANEGKLVKPYIVDEIRSADGQSVRTEPKVLRQVIRKETAETLAAMLVKVAEDGYDRKAQVEGYYLAGKTGTAQIAEKGEYGTKTNHTFVGFGPANDSKFTVLIKLHNVKNVGFAADSTTPLFNEIARFLLQYYKIPPSR